MSIVTIWSVFLNPVTIDDEYKSSNVASQIELRSISGNINLDRTIHRYIHLSATKCTVDLIVTDKNLTNVTGIIGNGMGIK